MNEDEPGAAEHAAGVAHRVVAFAFLPGAAPVRHRRAVDHDRARCRRGLEAASIIAAQPPWQLPTIAGLGLSGCSSRTLRTNCLLGVAHVEQRLAGLGLAEEDHEIDRMALAQRDADLRVVLEAADAGAVAGARVDDDVGAPLRIDRHALRRHDAHQRVVDRPLERAAVEHHLVVEVQDRRLAGALVLDEVVAALAHRVPEQHRALREIDRVFVAGLSTCAQGVIG